MKALLPFCIIAVSALAPRAHAQPAREAVLAAETRLAAEVAQHGDRAGFLAYAAPDGFLFDHGRPVNAAATWPARTPTKGPELAWHPIWADVAQSGDLAYTTGPWTLTAPNQTAPTAAGQYVTVWQRQHGEWKFAATMSVEHAPIIETRAGVAGPAALPAQATPMPAPADALLALDRRFAAAELREPAKTYEQYLGAEGRLYRPGQLALTGTTAQIVAESAGSAYLFVPATVRLATSGDLGFVVGSLRRPSPFNKHAEETGSYLRIWRREAVGGWRLALEMLNLTPADEPAVTAAKQ